MFSLALQSRPGSLHRLRVASCSAASSWGGLKSPLKSRLESHGHWNKRVLFQHDLTGKRLLFFNDDFHPENDDKALDLRVKFFRWPQFEMPRMYYNGRNASSQERLQSLGGTYPQQAGKDFDEVSIFRMRCTSVLLRTHAGRSTYHPVKPWGKLPMLLDGHHSRRIPFWDGWPCDVHDVHHVLTMALMVFLDDFRDEMHHDCQVFRKYDVDQDNHLDKALFLFLWLIWCNQRDACGPNMSTEGKQDETQV